MIDLDYSSWQEFFYLCVAEDKYVAGYWLKYGVCSGFPFGQCEVAPISH